MDYGETKRRDPTQRVSNVYTVMTLLSWNWRFGEADSLQTQNAATEVIYIVLMNPPHSRTPAKSSGIF
jgi:hypothetical protein